MIRKLLSRFSEPYRIRHGWGLSPIRNKREMEALIAFCEEELLDKEHMRLNKDRKLIYQNTIKLHIREVDNPFEMKPVVENGKTYYGSFDYINDHVGWYWT